MKISEHTQNLLPLGYLFLVIMGILKESVYYYQIGINILNYSSIMDILLSPIATLTSVPLLLIVLIFFIVVIYFLIYHSLKRKFKKENIDIQTDENSNIDFKNQLYETFIKILAMSLLCLFLGIGVGEGLGFHKKIKDNKLTYKHKLNYNSGDSEEIYLISTNSLYYFYIAKGQKVVKIAPIASIKNLELTQNPRLK